MPSIRIKEKLNQGTYFLTFTSKHWYYIFDRHNRWELLANCLKHNIESKNIKLHSYVFMMNHVHLIISSNNASGFVRDYKKYTSKKLKENFMHTEPKLISLFMKSEEKFEFWQKTNMPKFIENEEFYIQKVEYIQNNPVKKQYVTKPEHWYWSSANVDNEIEVISLI